MFIEILEKAQPSTSILQCPIVLYQISYQIYKKDKEMMKNKSSITMHDVENATKAFLMLHWNLGRSNGVTLPDCWAQYRLKGAVPFGERQGCYSLVKDGVVIYIGLGASRGGGIYKGHGIGARLNSHVLRWDRSVPTEMNERVYKPQEKWSGISEIFTYGFPSDYGYLACSLEAYLIAKLEPDQNVTKTSSVCS